VRYCFNRGVSSLATGSRPLCRELLIQSDALLHQNSKESDFPGRFLNDFRAPCPGIPNSGLAGSTELVEGAMFFHSPGLAGSSGSCETEISAGNWNIAADRVFGVMNARVANEPNLPHRSTAPFVASDNDLVGTMNGRRRRAPPPVRCSHRFQLAKIVAAATRETRANFMCFSNVAARPLRSRRQPRSSRERRRLIQ
jgi:hypothetical protein